MMKKKMKKKMKKGKIKGEAEKKCREEQKEHQKICVFFLHEHYIVNNGFIPNKVLFKGFST